MMGICVSLLFISRPSEMSASIIMMEESEERERDRERYCVEIWITVNTYLTQVTQLMQTLSPVK